MIRYNNISLIRKTIIIWFMRYIWEHCYMIYENIATEGIGNIFYMVWCFVGARKLKIGQSCRSVYRQLDKVVISYSAYITFYIICMHHLVDIFPVLFWHRIFFSLYNNLANVYKLKNKCVYKTNIKLQMTFNPEMGG